MISEKFGVLFVHIPKTAGQSIEHVFLEKHGLTWETRATLLLRPNSDPARGPVSLAHLFAKEYVTRGHISAARFAQLFKFAVVRDPYARFLSEFRYRNAMKPTTMQALFALRNGDPHLDKTRHLSPQTDFVTGGEGVAVDRILRFESLRDDIAPVFRHIFGETIELPRVNRSFGPVLSREDLPVGLRRRLYRFYERDFDLFRYPSGFAA
jgi:hypothetical protein